MSTQTAKYAKRKVARRDEGLKAEDVAWIERDLKEKEAHRAVLKRIKILEEQLKTVTAQNKEQEAVIVKLETDRNKNNKEIFALKERNKIINEKHGEVTDEFRSYKEISEKKYAELQQEHEEMNLRTQADFQNIQSIAKGYEEEAGNLQQAVSTLDREYRELKDRHKNLVAKLEDFLASEEDERLKQIQAEVNARISLVTEHEMEKEKYERRIKDLHGEIKALQHLKSLNRVIEKLKETVEEKCTVIKNKNIELSALKKEKEGVTECWHNEQNKTAIQQVQQKIALNKIKHLEDKIELEGETYHEMRKENDYYKGHNKFLTEQVSKLQMQMKGSEKHTKSLQEKINALKTSQQRFKEDLQTCMPLIDKPKQLKQRVIELIRVYALDEKSLQICDLTTTVCKFKVQYAETNMERSERIRKNDAAIRKRLEEQLQSTTRALEAKVTEYRSLLNDEIDRTHRLKKELREVKLKLEKATKPTDQKVKSWINKKILKKDKAIQPVEGEPPLLASNTLKPTKLELPSIPEEDFLTWEDFNFEDMFVHQDKQPTLPHSTPVKPKADDGLPSVDC